MKRQDYARRLKRQNVWLWALLALSFVYMVFIGEHGRLSSLDWTDTAENMQKVFFLWQGYIIWRIVHNRRLLREPMLMNEEMVKSQDERRAMIGGLAGRRFVQVFMILMSVANITAVFYDMTVFYTLYYTMLAALALWGGLYLWYRHGM